MADRRCESSALTNSGKVLLRGKPENLRNNTNRSLSIKMVAPEKPSYLRKSCSTNTNRDAVARSSNSEAMLGESGVHLNDVECPVSDSHQKKVSFQLGSANLGHARRDNTFEVPLEEWIDFPLPVPPLVEQFLRAPGLQSVEHLGRMGQATTSAGRVDDPLEQAQITRLSNLTSDQTDDSILSTDAWCDT